MTIKDIILSLERLAPKAFAEKWDNVGLLFGDENKEVRNILVCLDADRKALDLALAGNCQLIIAHHPLWFYAYKNLLPDASVKILIAELLKKDLAFIAAHTNLDACLGGVSDALGARLGLKKENYFSSLTRLTDDLAESWQKKLSLLDKKILSKYLAVNDFSHEAALGYGRIYKLETEISSLEFRRRTKNLLGAHGLLINYDVEKNYKKIAVLGGAYDSSFEKALLDNEVDCIVCGEMHHHDCLSLSHYGIHCLVVGHDVSERTILKPLGAYLQNCHKSLNVITYEGLDFSKLAP